MITRVRAALDGLYTYSWRFLEAMGDRHTVASPLGAWSLLALLAHRAPPAVRTELEAVLGCDAEDAFAFVLSLLELDHPAVPLVFGAWIDEAVKSPAWSAWIEQLPKEVAQGAMPTQAEANAWMAKSTRGGIPALPLDINALTAVLLTSGLAVDGKWVHSFKVSEPGELGPHEFENDVERVLVRRMEYGTLVRIHSGEIVGALVQEANEAYAAVAVVPPQGMNRERATATAHEVASMWQALIYRSNVSLFDLPLCDGPDWSIEEGEFETRFSGIQRRERSTVYIPAWDCGPTNLDLFSSPRFGFEAGRKALETMLQPLPPGSEFAAAQVASARYHRFGFTASAGTAFRMCTGIGDRIPHRRPERILTLRFRRPFPVVVVAKSPRQYQHMNGIPVPFPKGPHPWDHVPCITAWVTRMTEVEKGIDERGEPDWLE